MKRYVIERHIPGVGSMSQAQYKELAIASNGAVAKLSGAVQWVQSYITADNTFCVYLAEDEAAVREHALDPDRGRRLVDGQVIGIESQDAEPRRKQEPPGARLPRHRHRARPNGGRPHAARKLDEV